MADPLHQTTDPAGELLTEAFEAMGIKVIDVTPKAPQQRSPKEIMDTFDAARERRGCPPGLCLRYQPEDCKCANEAAGRETHG